MRGRSSIIDLFRRRLTALTELSRILLALTTTKNEFAPETSKSDGFYREGYVYIIKKLCNVYSDKDI